MADLLTYAVYLILLGLLIMFTSIGAHFGSPHNGLSTFTSKRDFNITHWISLLAISFIAGFRYNVGVDWIGYKNFFEGLRIYGSNSSDTSKMEIGYVAINQFVIMIGGEYTLMFFIVALFSWFFIFKSVPKKILPITIYFFFTGEYFFWSMNGVRQFMAMSVFFYALRFLITRNLAYYASCILFASLFHTSVLILLPFYFLPFDKLYNFKVWMILYFTTFFLNSASTVEELKKIIFNSLSNGIEIFSSYADYADHEASEINLNLHYGFGYYFNTLMTLFIFLISKYIIHKDPITKVYFIFFFIGACLDNIFIDVQIISRLVTYFMFFKPFLLSFIVYFFLKENSYVAATMAVIICILYFFIFLSTIYNSSNLCSPYNFAT